VLDAELSELSRITFANSRVGRGFRVISHDFAIGSIVVLPNRKFQLVTNASNLL